MGNAKGRKPGKLECRKRQHILLVSIETPEVCGERYILDDLKFYVIICSGSGSEDYRLKMADFQHTRALFTLAKSLQPYFKNWTRQIHL